VARWRDTWFVLAGAACVQLQADEARASLARNAAGPKNMGEGGALTVDVASQLGKEPDAKAWDVETGIQYQATDRLQLLVESLVFAKVMPDVGENVSGLGDTDLTASFLAVYPDGPLPAVVPAAKVKLPTAGSDEIGTGETDYSVLLILEKEYGELAVNVETEYVWVGSPADEPLDDQFLYTFTLEYGVSDLLSVYAEAFGNSAPSPTESRTDAALAGVELDLFDRGGMTPYLSFEIDTEETALARAGIELVW